MSLDRSFSAALSPGPNGRVSSQSEDDGSDDESGHFRYFLEDAHVAAQTNMAEECEINPLRRLLHNEYDPQTLDSLHQHISRIEMRLGHLERTMSDRGRSFVLANEANKNRYCKYEQINRYEEVEASFCPEESSQDENNVTVLFSKCWTIPQVRIRPGRVLGSKITCSYCVDDESTGTESSLVVKPLRMKGGGGSCDKKCNCCSCGAEKKQEEKEEEKKCPVTKSIRHTSCCCRCSDNPPLPTEPGPEKKLWCCGKFRVNYPRLVWKKKSQCSENKAQGCGDCKRSSGAGPKHQTRPPNQTSRSAASTPSSSQPAAAKSPPKTAGTTSKAAKPTAKTAEPTAKTGEPTAETVLAEDEDSEGYEEGNDEEEYDEEEERGKVHAVILEPTQGTSTKMPISTATEKNVKPRKAKDIETKTNVHSKRQADLKEEKTTRLLARKSAKKSNLQKKFSLILTRPKTGKKQKLPNSENQTDPIQLPPSISTDESTEDRNYHHKATSTASELLSPFQLEKERLKVETLRLDTKESVEHGEACDCAVCTHWKELTLAKKYNGKPVLQATEEPKDDANQKSHKKHVEGCKCALCLLKDGDLAHHQEENPLREHLRRLEQIDSLEAKDSFEKLLAKKTKAHTELCHCTICNQRRRIEILRQKLNEEMKSTEYFLRNIDSLSERNVSRLEGDDIERLSLKFASEELRHHSADLAEDEASSTEEHIHKPRRRKVTEEFYDHSGKCRKKTYGRGFLTSDGRRTRWGSSHSRRRDRRQPKYTGSPCRKRTGSQTSIKSGQSRCSKRSFTVCDCRYCKATSEKEDLDVYHSGHKHKDYDTLYKQTNRYAHGEYDHLLKSDKNGVRESYPVTLKNKGRTKAGPEKRRGKWRDPVDVHHSGDLALSSTGCEASCSGKCKLKLNPWTDFRQIGIRLEKPLERKCSKNSKIMDKITGWNTRNLQQEKLHGSSSNGSEEEPTNDHSVVGVSKENGWRAKTDSMMGSRYVSYDSKFESRVGSKSDSRTRLKERISNWNEWDDEDLVPGNQKSRTVPEWSN